MITNVPVITARMLLSRVPWRKVAIAGVFFLTLFFTVRVADVAIGIVMPAKDDPAVVSQMLSDITKVSAGVNTDLGALGFTLEGSPTATGTLTGTGSITATTLGLTTTGVAGLTSGAAASETSTPALPAWDRKGRVNILLMGLDGKASQGRYRRADTLIVVSIDPATNSAVLIGIPRDLYVTINSPKGQLRNRVNTAYVWGELYNYPGGGPALQMRTVGEVLGIPIHNYVSVYFDGFSKLIDAIGGIDINVPTAIRDTHLRVTFNTGMQHMDGWRALDYARSRYSTSDFSRGRRQQQVILAAIETMTKANLVAKLPAILPTVADSFRSDMSISELLSLASLGYKMDRSTIKTAQVDETMCQSWHAPDGAAVLLPKSDKIKPMVQAAIGTPVALTTTATTTTTTGTTASPVAPSATVTTTVTAPVAAPSVTTDPSSTPTAAAYRSESATVEILNGTNTIGLARRAQSWLQGAGFNVVRISDAVGIYNQTVLYYLDDANPATRAELIKLFNVQPTNVKALGQGGVSFRVVLGKDAKVP